MKKIIFCLLFVTILIILSFIPLNGTLTANAGENETTQVELTIENDTTNEDFTLRDLLLEIVNTLHAIFYILIILLGAFLGYVAISRLM